jgi:predicted lipoprotein with Yx(FWY)xxD motif
MKRAAMAIGLVLALATGAAAEGPAKVMKTAKGQVLADEKGMTLYVFDKDTANSSACYDTCAKNWPPFMASAKAKPEGEWTVVERKDGTKMWAYDGKPLYTFIKDKKPGEVMGDGVNGVWHAAAAD